MTEEIRARINIENGINQEFRGHRGKYLLDQLVVHLKWLRDRVQEGDVEAAQEFFKTYVFNDNDGCGEDLKR